MQNAKKREKRMLFDRTPVCFSRVSVAARISSRNARSILRKNAHRDLTFRVRNGIFHWNNWKKK
ncbi:MAG: hypothetical protein IKQ16_06255 [Lentisphaeria bacterium]|jgi:hypothetical protein|nr:hypothetical protein [Lentisphaeria bacterium]